MKRILVTGGSGFIGRNIKESYLNNSYEILAPNRNELDCSDDESVAAYFQKHYFDAVIHSAAKPGHRNAADPTSIFFTNSRMLFNLLRYHHRFGKLINMGSGAIYDMRHYQPKMKEDYFGTYIPADEHGYNKYIFGKVLPTLENVYDFRIFGIFGKYEDYTIRFISNAICKAIFELPITLRQDRKFDYLYIDDLYPILQYFIEYDFEDKAFNITPDTATGLLEIANIVRQVSGKNIPISVASDGIGKEYSGDNSLLRLVYPQLKLRPLHESIGILYQWYASHKDQINFDSLLTDK